MSALDKLRLELPDGRIFVAEGSLDLNFGTETQYAVNGFNQLLALFEEFAPELVDTANGRKQTVVLGAGAGRHIIRVSGTVAEGEANQWGGIGTDASALAKAQELDSALNSVSIDSEQAVTDGGPAILELGEYSDAGKFAPLTVGVTQSDIRLNTQEQTSVLDFDIEFLDIVDLRNSIHGRKRTPE